MQTKTPWIIRTTQHTRHQLVDRGDFGTSLDSGLKSAQASQIDTSFKIRPAE